MPSLKLTDSFCRGAKVTTGSKQEDYWDTLSPGLGLRVTAGGKRVWCYRYRWQGQRKRLTLLPFGNAAAVLDSRGKQVASQMTLSAARAKANELSALRDAGVNPATEYERAKEQKSVADENTVRNALERHLKVLEGKGRRPGYLNDIRILFDVHVLPAIGDMIITDVRPSDLAPVFKGLRARGAAATYNKLLAVVPPVFKAAKAADPITGQFDPMPKPTEPEALTLDQLAVLWSALDNPAARIHPLTAIAIRLSALTMKRSGEVVAMRVSELNFTEAVWNIPANRMKGGRPETVPLSDAALDLIRTALENSLRPQTEETPVCVFPSPRDPLKPMRQTALGYAFRRAKAVSSLSDREATLHTLRHTAATTLGEIGTPYHLLRALLSHAAIGQGVTSRYARYDLLVERRTALGNWAEVLERTLRAKN